MSGALRSALGTGDRHRYGRALAPYTWEGRVQYLFERYPIVRSTIVIPKASNYHSGPQPPYRRIKSFDRCLVQHYQPINGIWRTYCPSQYCPLSQPSHREVCPAICDVYKNRVQLCLRVHIYGTFARIIIANDFENATSKNGTPQKGGTVTSPFPPSPSGAGAFRLRESKLSRREGGMKDIKNRRNLWRRPHTGPKWQEEVDTN